MPSNFTAVLAVALLLSSLLIYLLLPSTTNKLPPGPPGLPIIGNLLQLPLKQLFAPLHAWAQVYGDAYTVNVAGKKIVVFSSAKSAADVLDRMSAVTSDRPRFVMAGEIMTRNLLYVFMPYGDRWRRLRRVTHEGFNIRACESYYAFQESEARNLVLSLLADPAHIADKLKHATAAATWRSLYSGPSLSEEDEEKVRRVDEVGEEVLKASMPMAFLVDVFPAMKALPSWAVGWKRWGETFFDRTDKFYRELLAEGRLQKKGVEHHLGFIASSAESFKRFEVTEQEAAWTAGGLFGAGVETSAAALHFFVQAMILYPDVARAAQKQIDNVVGNRAPSFQDRHKLPYVMALVKETLRWRPVAALGVPHVATEDLEYRGYVIPKGTLLMGNIWSISHDPTFFPSPDTFDPTRFLDSTGTIKEPFPDYHDDIVAYGSGRRICPGRDFANNTLFIDMAYLLWAFDFGPGVDDQGKEVRPDTTKFQDHGLIIHPAAFSYVLKPRRNDLSEIVASV